MADSSTHPHRLPDRLVLALGLASGLVAVVLGAIGAHGPLAPSALTYQRQLDTATLFHLVHSLGLMILAFWPSTALWRRGIALAWCLGLALFAGSLYALALFAAPWPGALTPLGGLLLMLGWLGWLVGSLGASRTP
ncbi:DUF423 domain-containing protein [Guyparkeria hydrothermalis]|uniref:DUF423 domain-containing protein n=1 Tax=Guyparkeria hydrothermalis TaxID=923 RepID=UPI00202280F4|nr:DUF423 domain-containing protein [Guyparkeria hydrothermalis]MCL7743760.1 DUF423 domain-containing protein [Guyparkeria hydrothermalis]